MTIVVTTGGTFQVDWWMDFREGELRIALDAVREGVAIDEPRDFRVRGPRDIERALAECGAPARDAGACSRRLWREGQRTARTHIERSLVTVREQPFAEYDLANQWTLVRGTELTRIAAGALADDDGQGVVIIARARADVSLARIAKPAEWTSIEERRVPPARGRLEIASAAGGATTLSAADGSGWLLIVETGVLSALPH